MPQQLPEDLSGPAPRDGELSSELGCFRNFGSEAVQGLSEFLDSLLLCGDEAILFKQLLFHVAELDIPLIILQRLLILRPTRPMASSSSVAHA